MNRRDALKLIVTAAAAPLVGRALRASAEAPVTPKPRSGRMPVIFLAHGAPPLLDDAAWMRELAAWSAAMPRPRAILMISAHWEERPLAIGATKTVPLVYDVWGFPERFYRVQYPSPGAPDVAARVRELMSLAGLGVTDEPERGLDHGAWVPLVAMHPKADVPVLQVSLPSTDPRELFAVGRALAPLRDEGVLIVGSGFLTHNLGAFSERTPEWARDFDAWSADVLGRRDVDALLDYRAKAPGVRLALPTHEHFVPVIVAAGAATDPSDAPTFPITGWAFGSFTKRSIQFG